MFGRSLTGAKGMPPQLLLTATAAAAAVDAVASWTAIALPCSYRRCRASRCVTAVLIDAAAHVHRACRAQQPPLQSCSARVLVEGF